MAFNFESKKTSTNKDSLQEISLTFVAFRLSSCLELCLLVSGGATAASAILNENALPVEMCEVIQNHLLHL